MKKLLAFHNKKTLKEKYIKRVEAHYNEDEIIHGIYWEEGKGCAVGCTVQKNKNAHQAMKKKLGIPLQIAYLEDRIFEGLKNNEAKEFPIKFLSAINVGADLSLVIPKFMVWALTDKKDGVLKYARSDGKKSIQQVADLYAQIVKGGKVTHQKWTAAVNAAAYAVNSAYGAYAANSAYAAAYAVNAASYAAYAANAAANAAYAVNAANAAANAANAAAYAVNAANAAAARIKHYQKMAAKLIELLKETK